MSHDPESIIEVARRKYGKYAREHKHCLNESCRDYEVLKCFSAGAGNPELKQAGIKICAKSAVRGGRATFAVSFERDPARGHSDRSVSMPLERSGSSDEDSFAATALFAEALAREGVESVARKFAQDARPENQFFGRMILQKYKNSIARVPRLPSRLTAPRHWE